MQKIIISLGVLVVLVAGFFLYRFTQDGEGSLGSGGDSAAVEREADRRDEGFGARRRSGDSGAEDAQDGQDEGLEEEDSAVAQGRSAILGLFVRRSSAVPAAGIDAVYVPVDGSAEVVAKSDDEGRFRLAFPAARPAGRLIARSQDLALEPRTLPAAPEGDILDLGRLELDPSVLILGRVIDAKGDGIKGAQVAVYPHEKFNMLNFDMVKLFSQVMAEDEPLMVTTSADDGSFRIEELPEGRWLLLGTAAKFASAFSSPFEVRSGIPAEVTLKLGPAKILAGLVKDEAGRPLAGARVMVMPSDSGPEGALRSYKTDSDAAGRFKFENLRDGPAEVFARLAGHVCLESHHIEIPNEEVELIMGLAASLEGRVFDRSTDKGIADAEVVGFQWESSSFSVTRSDEKGEFVLKDMPRKGELIIMVNCPGYSLEKTPDDDDGNPFGSPGLTIKDGILVSGHARREIAMVGGTSVEGRVYDKLTGDGIAGAQVRCLSANALFGGGGDKSNIQTVTDAEGKYRLVGPPVGRFTMLATAPGYYMPNVGDDESPWGMFAQQRTEGPEIVAGQTLVGVDVALLKGVRLSGKVVDAENKPVAGARIFWTPRDESPMGGFAALDAESHVTRADAEGGFEFSGLAAGMKISLHAYHRNFAASNNVEIDVGLEGTKDALVKLEKGGSVRGRLLQPGGQPAAGMVLRAEVDHQNFYFGLGGLSTDAEDGSEKSVVTTAADGSFSFENLPAGEIEVTLETMDDVVLAEGSRKLHVVSSETRQQNLQLEVTMLISGKVVDEQGNPQARAWVQVHSPIDSEDGDSQHGDFISSGGDRTDEQGRFEITGLRQSAKYRVTADIWSVTTASGEEEYTVTKRGAAEGVEAGTIDLLVVVKPAKE